MMGISLSSILYSRKGVIAAPKLRLPAPVTDGVSSSDYFRFSERAYDFSCVAALRIAKNVAPMMEIALSGTARLVDKAPKRFKGMAFLGYAIAEELRLQHVQSVNKQHIEKYLDRELKKIPEGWVGIGFHGSREKNQITLTRGKHLYIEVISPESTLETKVSQAQYCTFYTQGIGRLYILACRKEDEAAVRKEIKFCIEHYISPNELKDPKTGESRFKLIDMTAAQTFRSPYTVFRALNQNASTLMHEGDIIL